MALPVGHLLRVDRHGAVGLEHRAGRLAADETTAAAGHDRFLEVRRPGRGLDERREPEPEHPAFGSRRGLAFGPVLEVGDLQRALERGARRHADVERRAGEHLPRELVGSDDVAEADLVAADPELAGRDVEHALAYPRLHRPGSAVRHVRRLVRRGERGREPERRHAVRPRQHRADHERVHRRAERERRVCTLVHRHVHAQPEQRAVVAQRRLDVERLLAGLSRDQQVLVAVLDPLHRTSEVDCGREHRDVLAGREHLDAERAADVLGSDAWQRHRIPGQEPQDHTGEVHDADRFPQEGLRHRLAR